MFASFELSSHLPLMVGAPHGRPIAADNRLGGRTNERQLAEALRAAAKQPGAGIHVTDRRPAAAARIVHSRVDEPSNPYIPEGIGRGGVRQIAEGHHRHRRVDSQGGSDWLRDRRLFRG